MSPKQVFLREATGLVRSFSGLDALILSLAVTGPSMFAPSSQIGYVAPNDPGADFVLSVVYGLLFMIPLAIMYYMFSVQMPRSGGDYIWLGRTINPVLGFVGGWAMFISFVALLGSGSVPQSAVVIPDVAVAWGYIWNNPGLIAWGQNFANSISNVFFGALFNLSIAILITSFGSRVYRYIMMVLSAIIFLGTLIFIGALATASTSSFAAGLSSMTNGAVTYDGIISQAQQAGFAYVPINSTATFLAIPFGVLLFNGFNYSVYVSGEVKNVKKGMIWGVLAALLVAGVLDIIGIYANMQAEGYPFVQAVFALYGAGKFALGVSPWTPLFIPAVLSNPYLSSIVEIGFLLTLFWWGAGLALVVTRYVFAFSFDRVLPSAFADVNDRLHIPLKATGLTFVLGAAIIYLTVYTTYIGQLLNVTTIWTIVWILVGIAAIIFPFRRKDLAKGLIGGPRLLPIFGGLSIIAMGITFYWAVTTPAIGPSTLSSTVLLTGIFGSAIVIYVARYFYFKSRGFDLIQLQNMIPPE